MQNMGTVSDVYLPTNTLAALANLAPQVITWDLGLVLFQLFSFCALRAI